MYRLYRMTFEGMVDGVPNVLLHTPLRYGRISTSGTSRSRLNRSYAASGRNAWAPHVRHDNDHYYLAVRGPIPSAVELASHIEAACAGLLSDGRNWAGLWTRFFVWGGFRPRLLITARPTVHLLRVLKTPTGMPAYSVENGWHQMPPASAFLEVLYGW